LSRSFSPSQRLHQPSSGRWYGDAQTRARHRSRARGLRKEVAPSASGLSGLAMCRRQPNKSLPALPGE
jgi:hypothetical protein